MSAVHRMALAFGVATAALLAAPAASADGREQCVAASEKAQQLRNAGKLSEARDQLAICGRAECPKIVAQDCTQWMSEVLGILPSVVPGAKDRRGRDLIDVKVSVDGKVMTGALDGKPIAVDPGVHTFKFETKGAPPAEEKVVVRQGEKNRILTVTLAVGEEAPPAKKPGPIDVGNESDRREEPRSSAPPIAPFVVGGLGVVALGAALYLALDANSDVQKLREECAPRCNQADVDDIDQRRVIAGVTAAGGGALLIAGVVLFFVHGSSESQAGKSHRPMFAVSPLPGGASGGAFLRF